MNSPRFTDRGTTLIEAAIVLPVLLMVIVAILELGVAFKDFLTTDFSAKEGARLGALAGNDPDADCRIVQSIVSAYSASDFNDLDEIRIFEVDENGDSVSGTTNTWIFPNGPLDDPADCSDWNVTENWPALGRDVSVGPSATVDILAVEIDTNHDWITGFPPWNGSMEIVRTSIQRLEPEAFETAAP